LSGDRSGAQSGPSKKWCTKRGQLKGRKKYHKIFAFFDPEDGGDMFLRNVG
jgi:hypothetical protein